MDEILYWLEENFFSYLLSKLQRNWKEIQKLLY